MAWPFVTRERVTRHRRYDDATIRYDTGSAITIIEKEASWTDKECERMSHIDQGDLRHGHLYSRIEKGAEKKRSFIHANNLELMS